MSTWQNRRRSSWPLYAGIVLVAVSILSGLLQLYGLPGGDDDVVPPPSGPSATATGEPGSDVPEEAEPTGDEPPADPAELSPEVVSFGRTGTLLAVVVRNVSGQYLRSARVQILARAADGRAVRTTFGSAGSTCCTLLGLPDGGEYGVWANVAADAPEIDSVEVRVVAAQVGRHGDPVPTIAAAGASLERLAEETVVTATLTAHGPVDGYVAGQAFLADRNGRLVAVISGRFWCFEDGVTRTVRMQLPHAVPRGTRVARVLAYPVPSGVRAHLPSACS